MATLISQAAPAVKTRSAVSDLTITLAAVMLSSAFIVTGLIWDISWHRTVGRDTFWTLPHLEEQLGASLTGLTCGWLVLKTTFFGTPADKASTVKFWGFSGPLGAWVCIWGTLLMITSAPFDDWWHNAYGLDVQIVSPPHMVLLWGMVAIQTGAILMAVAAQNRATGAEARPYALVYAASGGLIVTMAATAIMEYASAPNTMHSEVFYKVTGAVLPVFLVAFGRAGRLRWPATTTAAIYMVLSLVMMWTLESFPATPKLAPIYNPVTHMVPPFFPLILIVPAFAIDLILKRYTNDWMLSVVIGVAFVMLMLAVHWFWSEFLLSPAARNFVFASDQWDYTTRLGPWRYEYWTPHHRGKAAEFPVSGLLISIVLATVSARVGLWWGEGMARLRR
ncbi:MAG TPA: hypothetical protein VFA43_12390 [Gemmatimonadaceae bacterium]|nr:hypothetical protein [Gemmatimonadaceae bacterium]